tara:strand:- start:407 stop:640 length:234 start_codon:yes stop_codon:yes gene_type:complete
MNKIIITISLLSALSCQENKKLPIEPKWHQLIDNLQDMKEWMKQDTENGIIDSAYSKYYLEYLNESQNIAIDLYNTK